MNRPKEFSSRICFDGMERYVLNNPVVTLFTSSRASVGTSAQVWLDGGDRGAALLYTGFPGSQDPSRIQDIMTLASVIH